MKITVLDDYQDVVKTLDCFGLLSHHEVSVLNETLSESELVVKLQETEVLVLIRERTVITKSLLSQLPNLKVISKRVKSATILTLIYVKSTGFKFLRGVDHQ